MTRFYILTLRVHAPTDALYGSVYSLFRWQKWQIEKYCVENVIALLWRVIVDGEMYVGWLGRIGKTKFQSVLAP